MRTLQCRNVLNLRCIFLVLFPIELSPLPLRFLELPERLRIFRVGLVRGWHVPGFIEYQLVRDRRGWGGKGIQFIRRFFSFSFSFRDIVPIGTRVRIRTGIHVRY